MLEIFVTLALLVVVAIWAIKVPEINNWIWLGWGTVTIILLIVAAFNFGSPIERHIIQERFLPKELVPPYHSWFWWNMFFSFLGAWIVLTPFCFWDEARISWRIAQRTIAQRPATLRRRPSAPPVAALAGATPAVTAPHRHTTIDRIVEWTERILPAELIAEFLVEIGPKIIAKFIP